MLSADVPLISTDTETHVCIRLEQHTTVHLITSVSLHRKRAWCSFAKMDERTPSTAQPGKDWASCLPCHSNSTAWLHDSVRFINNYPISFGQKSWRNLWWPADLQSAHCKDCSILQVCTTQHQKDQAQLLVQALVISRLDYCNALLAGLPSNTIKPLQMIQNAAARLVINEPMLHLSLSPCTGYQLQLASSSRHWCLHIKQPQGQHPPTSTHYYESTSPPEAPPTSTHYYESTSPPEAPPTSTHYYESTSPPEAPPTSTHYYESTSPPEAPPTSTHYYESTSPPEAPPTSTHYYESTSPPEAPPTSTHYYESTSPPEAPPTSTHYYESTSPPEAPPTFTHYYESTSPPEAPPTFTHYYESTSPPEAPPTSTHYYESTSLQKPRLLPLTITNLHPLQKPRLLPLTITNLHPLQKSEIG